MIIRLRWPVNFRGPVDSPTADYSLELAKLIRHAFWCSPRAARQIQGKRVLLIDDVLTTGATLEAAARRNKCRRVGVGSGLGFWHLGCYILDISFSALLSKAGFA